MTEQSEPRITLWIIIVQDRLSKLFRSKIVASVVLFFVPIMISGYILQVHYNYQIFTFGVTLALLWVAIAPFLIQHAAEHIKGFFRNHKHLFINESDWLSLYFAEVARIQSRKYLVFGVPWAIATSALVLLVKFLGAPAAIQWWCLIAFFILFFVSSIGFYGVYVLISMMKNICAVPIAFNPFHPDKFGGISDFGRFSVKGALYFSSGALVFPLVFESMNRFNDHTGILSALVYLLSAIFIAVMIASFLLPVLEIKKLADHEKEKVILESRMKLDSLINEFSKSEGFNLKSATQIGMHYYFTHQKLLEMKDYPWDFRVLLEFSLSFLIPVAITILHVVLKMEP